MAGKSLVIVESPTKARTITKFLGKEFVVKASNGHIRDLPNSAAEIPEKVKKEKWSRLGINVEAGFEALYVIPQAKKQSVKALKEALKNASVLYLATDEDREGESISWHLLETLKPTVPTKRLVFHEITREAIAQALANPREIDENLVKAQETRRIVDRLYGYELSPLLWKKMTSGLSAGRVQSVTIRLLVERERERIKFHKASYWGLKGLFQKGDSEFEATLTHVGEKRIAIGKDFDPETGKVREEKGVTLISETQATELRERLSQKTARVATVEEKPYTTKPAAPFVTSSLQQEGNRKLRLSAKRTMTIAQQLYENGFITYMRTDSVTLSSEALGAARKLVKETYGDQYLPESPRVYKTTVKNAQEAHEAIRPAGDTFSKMQTVRDALGPEASKLYDLIWKRTVASQMSNARGTHISVSIACDDTTFRASGKTIEFPGFLRAYVEGSDDPEAELADQERILPKVETGDELKPKNLEATEHSTQPPARYTEGSLIRELERRGIGRPSTWATVVETVLSRTYAFKKGTALVPTFTAVAVVGLLEQHFPQLLDYEFTARLEDDLDAISRGEAQNLEYLNAFYFGNGHQGLKELVEKGERDIDPREVCGVSLGTNAEELEIEVRIGRYGPFLSNGTDRAALPDALAPDELTLEEAERLLHQAMKGPEALGNHPESGGPIYLKTGRYGPYVQLGDQEEGGPKPKMASLLKNITPEEVDLEYAIKLLSLPRTLGEHPQLKHPIVAANGRYGPYLKCDTETRSINLDELSPLEITLEQAVHLLNQPKKRGRRSAPKVLKELGVHPVSEKPVQIKNGPYGPYVTDGSTNASLPKDADVDSISLERALNLLEEKEAKGGGRQRSTKKKTTAKPKAKKKTEAKSKKTGAKSKAKKKPTAKKKT